MVINQNHQSSGYLNSSFLRHQIMVVFWYPTRIWYWDDNVYGCLWIFQIDIGGVFVGRFLLGWFGLVNKPTLTGLIGWSWLIQTQTHQYLLNYHQGSTLIIWQFLSVYDRNLLTIRHLWRSPGGAGEGGPRRQGRSGDLARFWTGVGSLQDGAPR